MNSELVKYLNDHGVVLPSMGFVVELTEVLLSDHGIVLPASTYYTAIVTVLKRQSERTA